MNSPFYHLLRKQNVLQPLVFAILFFTIGNPSSVVANTLTTSNITMTTQDVTENITSLSDIKEASVNQRLPNFMLKDLKGRSFQLTKALNKGPIVISFWATWCVPCIQELKASRYLLKKYKKENLQFLAVSIDTPQQLGKIQKMTKKYKFKYRVLLDHNKDVYRKAGVSFVPYTLLLDSDGVIQYRHVGYTSGDEKKLDQHIAQLVKKKKLVQKEK